MKKNFFDRMSESYEKFHLQESELEMGNEKVYVNPKLKLALGWSFFILCCVLAYFLIGDKLLGGKQGKDTTTETPVRVDMGDLVKKVSESGNASVEGELGAEEIQTTVEQKVTDKLNDFVTGYYDAMTACDNTALQRMVVDPKPYRSAEGLKKKAKFITGYHDITVYAKEGPDPETYVVFVVANLSIEGVNSSPYDIMTLYIVNGSEGFRVNNGNLSDEVVSYIRKVQGEGDIQQIYQTIDQKNAELRESDETLKAFYDTINASNGQQKEEQAEESKEESDAEQEEDGTVGEAGADSEAEAQPEAGDGGEDAPAEEGGENTPAEENVIDDQTE